ncbi:MAG: hypothetical protein ACRCV9_14470 [Burkholderiaceae bacterium]
MQITQIEFLVAIYALIALGVGIAVGMARGRPLAGFLWALLLGPVGWLLVAVGPDMRNAPVRSAMRGLECPHCAAQIKKDTVWCNACKQRVLWIKGVPRKPAKLAQ